MAVTKRVNASTQNQAFSFLLLRCRHGWGAVLLTDALERKYPDAANGNRGKAKVDISVHGQESSYTTTRMVKINPAIRGVDGQITHGDTFAPTSRPTSSSSIRPSSSPTGAAIF